jgi:hypothetical protein
MQPSHLGLSRFLRKQVEGQLRTQFFLRWLAVTFLRARMRKSIPVPVKRATVVKKKILTTVHASPITMPTAAASPPTPPDVPLDSAANSLRLSESTSPVLPGKSGVEKKPTPSPSVIDVLGGKDMLTLRYAVEQQSKMLELRDRLINHLSKMRDEAVAKHDVEHDALVCSLRTKNIALEKRIEMLCSCLSLPREVVMPNPQLQRATASPSAENLVAIAHTVPTASAPAIDPRPSSAKAEEDRRRVNSARRKHLPPATSASTEDPQLFVLKSQNSMPVRPLKIKNPARRNSMHDGDPPDHHTTARIVIERVVEGRQPGVSASGGRSGSFIKVPKSPSLQSSALPLISSPQPGKR